LQQKKKSGAPRSTKGNELNKHFNRREMRKRKGGKCQRKKSKGNCERGGRHENQLTSILGLR